MFTLLLGGNGLLGTAFLLSPDIARLLNQQTEQVVQAYEDRITQLRVEVDRLHSRSYAQTGDINLQLQELAQQQDVLLEQHQLVRVLVDKAGELGIEAAALSQPAYTSAPLAYAVARTDSIVAELSGLGIVVDLPTAESGMGGPLLAPIGDSDSSLMVDDANAVMAALLRYKAARDSIEGAPVHMPIAGDFRRSSGFGNRTD